MLEVTKTCDRDTIESILFHDSIKPYLFIMNEAENNNKNLFAKGVHYYLLKKGDEKCGLVILAEMDNNILAADVGILPEYRGRVGILLGKMALKKIYHDTKCKAIVARIDKKNKPSLFYTILCGFKKVHEDEQYKYLRA